MTDPVVVRSLVDQRRKLSVGETCLLPPLQNLESVVYGTELVGEGKGWLPGDYCLESLYHIEKFEFKLLDHPLIQAVLDTIPFYKDETLILEVEAPFSILSALMDPMKLYLCFEEEENVLLDTLYKIAHASARYIRACVEAGCRFISLADPTGTVNLVGENYYKKFCGPSTVLLMKECEPFLDKAVIHLCKKQAQSLVMTGLAIAEPIRIPEGLEDYRQILSFMAGNEDIHFVGMTCLHDKRLDLRRSCRLRLT